MISLISSDSKQGHQIEDKVCYQFNVQVFEEITSVLNYDNSKFWKHNFNGPKLLVDPETKTFFSNQNNKTRDLQMVGKVYPDTLPTGTI